ncbi:MAG: hypothetical protein RLN88_11990 [Ekhidna sp.]|uniref:hypothetical protein n=1 Tax=Ekhidna sp. TaxID=2608089 RepID=UPI0032EA9A1D
MKRLATLLLIPILLSSCYQSLSIDGFDKDQWTNYAQDCSSYRLDIAELIIKNEDILLEGTQNEIEGLLGKASEHELYERNQKFFHYRLTPPEECGDYEVIQFLSIRFNAIGRANLVQVMVREP